MSGLSAGAYMAGQVQLAHSRSIVGAGLVAGGPFACAESAGSRFTPFWPAAVAQNLAQALNGCLADNLRAFGIPSAPRLADRARELAGEGRIDPIQDLAKDRIYLFSGGADYVVARSVVEAAAQFYGELGVLAEQVRLVTNQDAGHAFLTEDSGAACGVSRSPFISDCDYDQAGSILQWIYGELASPAAEPQGNYITFSQQAFDAEKDGLGKEGVVYVPEACRQQSGCRLHIALHGCEQGLDQIGMRFVEESGFARWADTNRLVDHPSFRICRFALIEVEEMLGYGARCIAQLVTAERRAELRKRGLNPASHFSLHFFDPLNSLLETYGAGKVFLEGDAVILSILEHQETLEHQFSVARACGLANADHFGK